MTTPKRLDRRLARRHQSVAEHGIVSALVRPGIDASVIDVSVSGALIETRQRLLPGSSVEIHFDQEKRLPPVRGTILRCAVARLGPTHIHYQGAILFDHRLTWLEEDGHGYSVPDAERPVIRSRRASATRIAR